MSFFFHIYKIHLLLLFDGINNVVEYVTYSYYLEQTTRDEHERVNEI